MSLLEETRRIEDYAVFTFPRVIEGLWFLFKRKLNLNDIPEFDRILFASCFALIFYLKKYNSSEIPSHYIRQFDFFFGN